jgi:hypothetical protein
MTSPEEALAHARAQAASMRASGAYGEVGPAPPQLDSAVRRLSGWALVEPDPKVVYSTRRYGAPITWFKRMLVRLLLQYHAQLISEQTRFNVALLSYARSLERRIEELERDRAQ